jgi:hypothetical protein
MLPCFLEHTESPEKIKHFCSLHSNPAIPLLHISGISEQSGIAFRTTLFCLRIEGSHKIQLHCNTGYYPEKVAIIPVLYVDCGSIDVMSTAIVLQSSGENRASVALPFFPDAGQKTCSKRHHSFSLNFLFKSNKRRRSLWH